MLFNFLKVLQISLNLVTIPKVQSNAMMKIDLKSV